MRLSVRNTIELHDSRLLTVRGCLLLATLALACSAHQEPLPPTVDPKPAPRQESGGGVAPVALLKTDLTRPFPETFRFARFFARNCTAT